MSEEMISSHGYIKNYVGCNHPQADSKGYVYEHRIIAEKFVGRPLFSKEIVHHKDGNTQNNSLNNLEIVQGRGGHWLKHRKRSDLRIPGEQNPIVKCLCGCGVEFPRFDLTGRPRQYASGHNTTKNKVTGRFEVLK